MTVNFNTVEDALEASKDINTDPATIQAIMDGDITIGEPVLENPEITNLMETPVPAEEQVLTPPVEPVIAPAPILAPIVDSEIEPIVKTPTEIANEMFLAEKANLELAHKTEIDSLRESLTKKSEIIQEEIGHEAPTIDMSKIDLDAGNDISSTFEQNTRELTLQIQKMVEQGGNLSPEVLKQLTDFNENKDLILDAQQKQLENIQKQNDLNNVFSQTDQFIARTPGLNIPVKTSEAFATAKSLKSEISKIIGSTEWGSVENAYRKTVRGSTAKGKEIRAKLTALGKDVPDWMGDYLNVTVIDDARCGKKFNEVTETLDVIQTSLDDQYKIQNFNTLLNKGVRGEMNELADALDGKQNSATSVLDVQVLETTNEPATWTLESAQLAMNTDFKDMKSNPKLAEKFVEAYEWANLSHLIPDAVKRLLT